MVDYIGVDHRVEVEIEIGLHHLKVKGSETKAQPLRAQARTIAKAFSSRACV